MNGGFAGEADQLRRVFPVGVFPAYQAALLSWTPGRICHMLAVARFLLTEVHDLWLFLRHL
jgi:hypothetical protein